MVAMLDDDKKKIFKKIFLYHAIPESPELNEIWGHDLIRFSAVEIKSAWDDWRMIAENERRKPKSFDLVRIIRSKTKPIGLIETENKGKLKFGRSETEDELIRRLQKMNKTNPKLLCEIQQCDSAKEKMALCAIAANMDIQNNALAKNLIESIHNSVN